MITKRRPTIARTLAGIHRLLARLHGTVDDSSAGGGGTDGGGQKADVAVDLTGWQRLKNKEQEFNHQPRTRVVGTGRELENSTH